MQLVHTLFELFGSNNKNKSGCYMKSGCLNMNDTNITNAMKKCLNLSLNTQSQLLKTLRK